MGSFMIRVAKEGGYYGVFVVNGIKRTTPIHASRQTIGSYLLLQKIFGTEELEGEKNEIA